MLLLPRLQSPGAQEHLTTYLEWTARISAGQTSLAPQAYLLKGGAVKWQNHRQEKQEEKNEAASPGCRDRLEEGEREGHPPAAAKTGHACRVPAPLFTSGAGGGGLLPLPPQNENC